MTLQAPSHRNKIQIMRAILESLTEEKNLYRLEAAVRLSRKSLKPFLDFLIANGNVDVRILDFGMPAYRINERGRLLLDLVRKDP